MNNKIKLLFFFFYVLIMSIESFSDDFEETLGPLRSKTPPEVQTLVVNELIKRVLGEEKAALFKAEVDGHFDPETFQIFHDGSSNLVSIRGSSAVSVATGLNWYLKYYCNCHISWEISQLELPQELPAVNLTIQSEERFRYYQNVCTSSYSFAWWQWSHWEKHLDWMALNGINLALAFVGQEAVWQRVYQRLGLSQQDINEHFAGPAFFAWQRMGNIRGWGGPLSSSWHEKTITLQKQILERMHQLGMTPVLPAFAGQVPIVFKRLFPNSSMTPLGTWNGFQKEYCCPYLLEPTDPLFLTVGSMFLEEQTDLYGTGHIYNCDTFNEMTPSSGDLTYLGNVAKAIFSAMTHVDSQAVWMLQGWFFLSTFWTPDRAKAFLTNVPLGRLLVLDLQSEQRPQYKRLESYYGQPWIWCMLHNFGGTLGFFGTIDSVNNGVFDGRTLENSTMVGTGITPEGINQNYPVYDQMLEMSWRNEPIDLDEWFSNYALRRYGIDNADARQAWKRIEHGILNNTQEEIFMHGQHIIILRPSLRLYESVWYNQSDLFIAWDEMIAASNSLGTKSGFQHDLVDLTRQCLQVLASSLYYSFVLAFNKKDTMQFNYFTQQFLKIFDDLDQILATNRAFMLGPWIKDARDWASSSQEEIIFEYNARNQITLWGPNGEIVDYANKQWAGVVSDYMKPRWEYFIQAMNDSLIGQIPFNQTKITQEILEQVEKPFAEQILLPPIEPTGDTIPIAKEIHEKWRSIWTDFENIKKPQVVLLNR